MNYQEHVRMDVRDRINLPVQLQRLKELNHNTAGATFHFTYNVKTQEWVVRLTSKAHISFKHIIPEFAIMNACEWIVSNRVVGKKGKYTLFKCNAQEGGSDGKE